MLHRSQSVYDIRTKIVSNIVEIILKDIDFFVDDLLSIHLSFSPVALSLSLIIGLD